MASDTLFPDAQRQAWLAQIDALTGLTDEVKADLRRIALSTFTPVSINVDASTEARPA